METNIIERSPTFITLNNKLLAEYTIVFRINDSFSIDEYSNFKFKHQLLFQKIENKNQQLNLMFVDSVFVHIIADLCLEVLLKKISSFEEYILSKDKVKLVKESSETNYFNYKFSDFIHLLLYSDISNKKLFNQEFFADRVFCLRNKFGELEYFSIFEQTELKLKLLKELRIEIDFNLSSISNQETRLCLKFFTDNFRMRQSPKPNSKAHSKP